MAATRTKAPRAPAGLSARMARWWREVHEQYSLEPHHCLLLELAARAFDRGEAARQVVEECGLSYVDDNGSPHARPETRIERASREQFRKLVAALDLDFEPPQAPGRPPRRPIRDRS